VIRPEIPLEAHAARLGDRFIMPSEPIAMIRSTASSGISAGPSVPEPYASIASTTLPTKARSCRRPGAKPGGSSQHQMT